jgi:hypothetical protein
LTRSKPLAVLAQIAAIHQQKPAQVANLRYLTRITNLQAPSSA